MSIPKSVTRAQTATIAEWLHARIGGVTVKLDLPDLPELGETIQTEENAFRARRDHHIVRVWWQTGQSPATYTGTLNECYEAALADAKMIYRGEKQK